MQEVEFRVLGPFEVLVEGRALELKRRKQRSLLTLLILRAGEVVSTDYLVDELWASTLVVIAHTGLTPRSRARSENEYGPAYPLLES